MKTKILEMTGEPAMAIRKTTTMETIKEVIKESYAALYTYITEAGGQASAAPYVAYFGIDQEFEMEIGVPVVTPLPAQGDIFVSATPSGKAVTVTHTGPYSELETVYSDIFAFIQENMLMPTGVYYEFYENDPEFTPEAELVTNVVIPISEKTFCQSCGMPLSREEDLGTNADGNKSNEYCVYCYQNGAFTADVTMDEMIAYCAPMTAKAMKITEEEATAQMKQFFPMLKRWK